MTTEPLRPVQDAVWDDAAIRQFWGYWSRPENDRDWYFSKYFSTALVHLADWSGNLGGRMLDYGCALGYLCTALVKYPVEVEAVEFNQESLNVVDQRLRQYPNWKGGTLIEGVPTPLPSERFDLVYCVEVVEHLQDQWLASTLQELHRLLKPGGNAHLDHSLRGRLARRSGLLPLLLNALPSGAACPFHPSRRRPGAG